MLAAVTQVAPFRIRAGSYRFVQVSSLRSSLGEYLSMVTASGAMKARNRKLYMEVRS